MRTVLTLVIDHEKPFQSLPELVQQLALMLRGVDDVRIEKTVLDMPDGWPTLPPV